jgi:bacillopeptidase F (M6 metalloprotease family)
MTAQPTVDGGAVATPQANYCPGNRTRSTILADSFENFSSTRWKLGSNLVWNVIGVYAEDGKYSVYAVEPSSAVNGYYTSSMTLQHKIKVPKSNQAYLRFAHQYRLSAGLSGPYYDGVLVEYRVNGKGSWLSLSDRHWQNGPNRNITPSGQSSFTGWGGNSAGYRSSKVDISFLKGKTVQFRWRMVWDGGGAVDGWTIDDVRFFTCKP